MGWILLIKLSYNKKKNAKKLSKSYIYSYTITNVDYCLQCNFKISAIGLVYLETKYNFIY